MDFLGRVLRDNEPPPEVFMTEFQASVARGEIAVFAARSGDGVVGVATVHYRFNVSVGGRLASIEELHVRLEDRGKGLGRALLGAAIEDCANLGISYIEVQTDDPAKDFYTACGFEAESEVRVMSLSNAL